MVPKNDEASSNDLEDPEEKDSVFDFLYQDVKRVGSFLAQMPGGHASSTKQIVASETAGGQSTKLSAGGAAAFVKANAEESDHNTTTNRDSLERSVDPFWSNAVDLLNLLTQNNIINYNIETAGLGSFVLITGELLIIDTANSRPPLTIPEVKSHLQRNQVALALKINKFITLVGDSDPDKLNLKDKEKRAQRDARLSAAIIATLPDTIQIRVRTDAGHVVFCPVVSDGLIASASSLTMTHGAQMQGIWHVLGIYDAKPDDSTIDIQSVADRFNLKDSQSLRSAVGYSTLIRSVGRTNGLYGVTPLLIFRHIGISP